MNYHIVVNFKREEIEKIATWRYKMHFLVKEKKIQKEYFIFSSVCKKQTCLELETDVLKIECK